MKQPRNLLLTTMQLCNVRGHEFQRRIQLCKMKALSKSTEPGNLEFIVHVKDEYDYRFVCYKRDDLFEQLKACFFNLMNKNLPIYGVPAKLKEYSTSKKDIKNGCERLPPDTYYLKDEEVYEALKAPQNTLYNLSIEEDDLPAPG